MTELQSTFRSLMLLLVLLGLLGAAAYTVGLIQHWNRDDLHPEVYGISRLYTDQPAYTMPIFFWQGKASGDPTSFIGRNDSGDVHGNSTSFSLRQLNPLVSYDSVDWVGYNEDKYLYPYYATPTFTVQNKTGGEIFAIYEHWGYGNVIFSDDTSRRPVEYEGWLDDEWLHMVTGISKPTFDPKETSRYDVYTNYSGYVENIASEAVVHVAVNPYWTLYRHFNEWIMSGWSSADIGLLEKPSEADEPGEFSYPTDTQRLYFSTLYPRCSAIMQGVYRIEVTSYLNLYAMSPTDPDDVIVSARIRLTHYSPWMSNHAAFFDLESDAEPLTEAQKKELQYAGESSHWGCQVMLVSYEEELQLVE